MTEIKTEALTIKNLLCAYIQFNKLERTSINQDKNQDQNQLAGKKNKYRAIKIQEKKEEKAATNSKYFTIIY